LLFWGRMSNNIRIVLTLDGKQYEAELTKQERNTDKFGQTAARTGTQATILSTAVRALGYSLTAIGAIQVVRQISDIGVQFERTRQGLLAVSNGTAHAERQFTFISDTAERLGLDIGTVADGYVRLAAATRGTALEGKVTEDVFAAVSEASAKLSLSAADTAGVLRALTQIASKGTLSAEELRQQLGDRLPGALRIAATAMGVTEAQLNSMLQRGEVMASDFLPRFGVALREAFGTGADTRIDTTASSFGRLSNQIRLMADVVAQELNPKLKVAADILAAALERARTARQITPETIGRMSDEELAAWGFTRAGGGSFGLEAPFTTVGGGIAARLAGQFPGAAGGGPAVDFYGAMPPHSLTADQQKNLDLLREEYELLQLTTHEEKALYQITMGRYRDESKEAKDLILARGKLLDQREREKKLEEDEKKRQREAEKMLRDAIEREELDRRHTIEQQRLRFESTSQYVEDLDREEARIERDRLRGNVSRFEADRRTDAARERVLTQLQADLGAAGYNPEQLRQIQEWIEDLEDAREPIAELTVMIADLGDNTLTSFRGSANDAFASFLDGTRSASEAWEDFGASVSRVIARITAELAVTSLITGALAPFGMTLSGGRVVPTGAPAAPTGGGFTAPPTYAAGGGYIQGPGSSTSDSIPARLSTGEYVIRASKVQQYGREYFDHLNFGGARRFADGGYVAPAGAPAQTVININAAPGVEVHEQRRRRQGGLEIVDLVAQQSVSDISRGGPMSRALEQTYGLRRAGRTA
jgi:tape measure domain-containing protein